MLRPFHIKDGYRFYFLGLRYFRREFCDPKNVFFLWTQWYQSREVNDLISFVPKLTKDGSNFYIFANSTKEYELISKVVTKDHTIYGTGHFNHGFHDGKEWFRITPEEPKFYDAVLTARKSKNQWMAGTVPNLAVLDADSTPPVVMYGNMMIPEGIQTETPWRLPIEGVCKTLNQSRIGLCLTRVEGICRASLEYQLCGLPVVSARSNGGRECWYTPTNSLIFDLPAKQGPHYAAECQELVRSKVEEMQKLIAAGKIDTPEVIRARCQAVNAVIRKRFLQKIESFYADKHLGPYEGDQWWIDKLNKLPPLPLSAESLALH